MFRKKLFGSLYNRNFKERGTEILRIEALSDAVFAFSVSLLVVSLEVPETFTELKTILQGAIPFFATITMIFLLWYQQYKFFRNYGLNDFITIILNLAYLAVILFYIYPLKFLFSVLLSSATGINLFPHAIEKGITIIRQEDFAQLIILFSIGYSLIWLLLFFMQQRAVRFRNKLALDQFEILYISKEKRGAIWNVYIGLAAILFAFAGWELLSGICYLFIPVLLKFNKWLFDRKANRILKPK